MNTAITAAMWIIFLTFGSAITQMEETTQAQRDILPTTTIFTPDTVNTTSGK